MSNNPAEYGRYGVDKKVLKQMPGNVDQNPFYGKC